MQQNKRAQVVNPCTLVSASSLPPQSALSLDGVFRAAPLSHLCIRLYLLSVRANLGTGNSDSQGSFRSEPRVGFGSLTFTRSLREAAAPHLSPSGDPTKDFALTNPSGSCPFIECGFHPVRNGHRANVATFANQINNGPVCLAHLDVVL